MGWLPIDSAPRNGEPFFVLLEEKMLHSRIHTATFHPNVECIGGRFSFDAPKATHWLPQTALPAPPGGGE